MRNINWPAVTWHALQGAGLMVLMVMLSRGILTLAEAMGSIFMLFWLGMAREQGQRRAKHFGMSVWESFKSLNLDEWVQGLAWAGGGYAVLFIPWGAVL